MLPIKYQVVGEEDYAFLIAIDEHGEYTVSGGTYTTDRPRSGKLTAEQETLLIDAIDDLGTPQEHALPAGAADAFKAKLTVGENESEMIYPFWEGALEEDSRLLKLIRLLEMI